MNKRCDNCGLFGKCKYRWMQLCPQWMPTERAYQTSDMIRDILRDISRLTEWERSFVESIANERVFSDRQMATVIKLHRRCIT